jgi:hypothetical protein
MERRRFTVAEYYAMAEAGILRDDDRVELIEGEIIAMSPINAPHAGHINGATRVFSARLGDKVLLGVQNPIRLGDDTDPQPDIALLKPRADDYKKKHPIPADVLLIVEISDTTPDYDRDVKTPLYARAGIPELWIVNLPENRLEVYRDPSRKGYKTRLILERGESVSPLAFPKMTFRIEDIVG